MRVDAVGNKHDRAGQFAGHVRSAPTGTLGDSSTGTPVNLARALDAFDLDETDLPGIAEAWEESFGDLERGPEPEDWDEVVADAIGQIAYDAEVVSDTGDQAVIRYVTEDLSDDDYRAVTDQDMLDRLRQAAGSRADRRARQVRDKYAQAEIPIWRLLADPREVGEKQLAVETARNSLVSHRAPWAHLDTWQAQQQELNQTFRQALEDGTEIPDGMLDKKVVLRDANGRKVDYFFGNQEDLFPVRGSDARDLVDGERQAQEQAERLATAWEQARSLPDGPLRSFLVDERPERTYPVSEGKGRSKRTVHKTYRPKSDLQSEHESAMSTLARRRQQRESMLRRLDLHLEQTTQRAEELAAAREAASEQLAVAERELWSLGWPGDLGDVPTPIDEGVR